MNHTLNAADNLQLGDLLDLLNYTEHERVSISEHPRGQQFRTVGILDPTAAAARPTGDHSLYFGVNPVADGTAGRGAAADVTRLAALWTDLDVKPGCCVDREDVEHVISLLSGILGTGHHYHLSFEGDRVTWMSNGVAVPAGR